MNEILDKLILGEDLSHEEMEQVLIQVMAGQVSDVQLAAFLTALKIKGETSQEIASLARVLRQHALVVPTQQTGVMDNCGTGGDQSFSFNVSTTTSFVLAGAGIPIAKHGNRSISSKSGSADVLEALGLDLSLPAERLGQILDEVGIVFLFAQTMHPGMKYIMPARHQLGLPTILNYTGPLTNPVQLKTQLLGTSRADLLEKTARALQELGRERAVVVTGPNGMDEAALHGVTQYVLLDKGVISRHSFSPADVGMAEIPLEAIRGGDAQENAQILVSVLKNEPSPYLEVTVLNAGLGLLANGRVDDLADGIALARDIIASGKAYAKLKALQEVQHD